MINGGFATAYVNNHRSSNSIGENEGIGDNEGRGKDEGGDTEDDTDNKF